MTFEQRVKARMEDPNGDCLDVITYHFNGTTLRHDLEGLLADYKAALRVLNDLAMALPQVSEPPR